jgi:hypothetical protein
MSLIVSVRRFAVPVVVGCVLLLSAQALPANAATQDYGPIAYSASTGITAAGLTSSASGGSPSPMLAAAAESVPIPATTKAATAVSVSVPATGKWVDTKTDVKAGALLTVTATGSWTDGSVTSGPNGAAKQSADNFFNLADLGACMYCAKTATSFWGALVGYIGTSPPAAGSYSSASILTKAGKVFFVGAQYKASAPGTGRLWLNKNADAYSNYTVDNRGSVVAHIAVSAAETAKQYTARARATAASITSLTSLDTASNYCLRAIGDHIQSVLIDNALDNLLPEHGKAVYKGITIAKQGVDIIYQLETGGDLGHATFEEASLIFDLLGDVPGFELFGLVGPPAVSCVEAGFWYTGRLGTELGQLLRKQLQPPAVVKAPIGAVKAPGGASWTLNRSNLVCTNFPDGCSSAPIPVKFTGCTSARCTMSRTDRVWKATHPITRSGTVWSANFIDIGVSCGTQLNPAKIKLQLSVTSTTGSGTSRKAKSLGGTYTVDSATNPPNCHANGHATYALYGNRT